jgi:hypothetical protein
LIGVIGLVKMSKVITSPIERFAGTVTIADPITLPQAQAIERGLVMPEQSADGRVWLSVFDGNQLPAIFACVEKWELTNIPDNVTADNFPASPRVASHKLIDWIFSEIRNVYLGELEIPNESNPPLSDTQAKDDIPQK